MLANDDKQWIRDEIKSSTKDIREDVAQLKSDVAQLKDTVEKLNDNVVRTNLYLENTLAPLISELCMCYTSAMSDCRNRTAEIDDMKTRLDACCSLSQENSVKIRCLEAAQQASAANVANATNV